MMLECHKMLTIVHSGWLLQKIAYVGDGHKKRGSTMIALYQKTNIGVVYSSS